MKGIIIIILFFVGINSLSAQSNALLGKWILDTSLTPEGKLLPLDDPLFSSLVIYEFTEKKLAINEHKFDAEFSGNYLIDLGNRKLNYEIRNEYLYIQESNNSPILCFLKFDDFRRIYPEFQPKEIVYQGKNVFIYNDLVDIKFNNDLTFFHYIINCTPLIKNKTSANYYFTIKYVLNTTNEISNIEITNISDEKVKKQLVNTIQKSAKFYQNNSGKNLLMKEKFLFFKMHEAIDETVEATYKSFLKGNEFFNNLRFQEALVEYENGLEKKFDTEKFYGLFYSEYIIKLGISYLISEQKEKACSTFRKLGDETNFSVRNFLRYYCQ
ncbi:hypothetical protein ABE545_17670 [Sphingobacterium faecium]|uniref:hypothetical protein n=2 Tax=Sphingobacterium TaxID=28453 RepID=UPI00320A1CED